MRKKSFVVMLALVMVFAFAIPAMAAQVFVDGNQLNVSTASESGTTLVPLRAIFQALGADVNWDGATQTVTASKGQTTVKLQIGSSTAYRNGQAVALQVPGKIIKGNTMVPLRFVSEALGASVNWDGATKTVTITSTAQTSNGPVTTQTKVHFIDVGQADSIYIELPNDNDILIDAGNKADGSTVVSYLKSQGVDDIELLIATHPHEDHIGGLPAILDAFTVEKIVDSGFAADSNIYANYKAKAKAENAAWQADNYQTYTFGNVALQVLTGTETWEDTNDYSVACRLDTGDIEFLLTGDAEGPAEAALSGNLEADVLKVGHHGSSTSTASSFLSKVDPKVAIISVGAGNSYGHPAAETVQRIQASGAKVFRTDLNGNIVVTTDGKTYSVSTQRNNTAPVVKPAPVTPKPTPAPSPAVSTGKYVGSDKSNKYHDPSCRYAESIAPENEIWFKDAADAQAQGYVPCGVCKP